MSDYATIRCGEVRIKFKQNSGQNTLELRTADVGATDFLDVYRVDDELRVFYVRKSLAPETDVVQESLCFNFDTVLSYTCEKIRRS